MGPYLPSTIYQTLIATLVGIGNNRALIVASQCAARNAGRVIDWAATGDVRQSAAATDSVPDGQFGTQACNGALKCLGRFL